MMKLIDMQWCKRYFNECFPLRKFTRMMLINTSDAIHDEYGDYQFIQGKVHYDIYLDIPQSVIF